MTNTKQANEVAPGEMITFGGSNWTVTEAQEHMGNVRFAIRSALSGDMVKIVRTSDDDVVVVVR